MEKSKWAKLLSGLFRNFGGQGFEMLGVPSAPVNTFDAAGQESFL